MSIYLLKIDEDVKLFSITTQYSLGKVEKSTLKIKRLIDLIYDPEIYDTEIEYVCESTFDLNKIAFVEKYGFVPEIENYDVGELKGKLKQLSNIYPYFYKTTQEQKHSHQNQNGTEPYEKQLAKNSDYYNKLMPKLEGEWARPKNSFNNDCSVLDNKYILSNDVRSIIDESKVINQHAVKVHDSHVIRDINTLPVMQSMQVAPDMLKSTHLGMKSQDSDDQMRKHAEIQKKSILEQSSLMKGDKNKEIMGWNYDNAGQSGSLGYASLTNNTDDYLLNNNYDHFSLFYNKYYMTGILLNRENFDCSMDDLKYFEEIDHIKNIDMKLDDKTRIQELFLNRLFQNTKEVLKFVEDNMEKRSVEPTMDEVIGYINKNFVLGNDIGKRIKFSILNDYVIKYFKLSREHTGIIKRKLPFILRELGLKKKRYSDGMYWYGIESKKPKSIDISKLMKNGTLDMPTIRKKLVERSAEAEQYRYDNATGDFIKMKTDSKSAFFSNPKDIKINCTNVKQPKFNITKIQPVVQQPMESTEQENDNIDELSENGEDVDKESIHSDDNGSFDMLEELDLESFPKDQLTPEDLLSKDSNKIWSEVLKESLQQDLSRKNFIEAGIHIGISGVAQRLRNPNLQIHGDPPNPQTKVCPWAQSTIGPDTSRRAMEIGGDEITMETLMKPVKDYEEKEKQKTIKNAKNNSIKSNSCIGIWETKPGVAEEVLDQRMVIQQIKKAQKHATVAPFNSTLDNPQCLFCDIKVGGNRFQLDDFSWSSGYIHYLDKHNVKVDGKFKEYLNKKIFKRSVKKAKKIEKKLTKATKVTKTKKE
jgi:hypothetical protein